MRKSQILSEKVIVIAALVVAVLVMQAYVRRGFSGRVKELTDSSAGNQFDPLQGNYEEKSFQRGDVVYTVKYLNTTEATGKTPAQAWLDDFIANYNSQYGRDPSCFDAAGSRVDCYSANATFIGNKTTPIMRNSDKIYPVSYQVVGGGNYAEGDIKKDPNRRSINTTATTRTQVELED